MPTHLNPPSHCDICKSKINGVFFDAKTCWGPWANLCAFCFDIYGVGLGTGRGQRWEMRRGKFEKTGG